MAISPLKTPLSDCSPENSPVGKRIWSTRKVDHKASRSLHVLASTSLRWKIIADNAFGSVASVSRKT